MRTFTILTLARNAGGRLALERAVEQLWLDKTFFGLRCDLETPRRGSAAKIPVRMEPIPAGFQGFVDEFAQVRGADAVEVYARQNLYAAGVPGGHLTCGPDGRPAYVQWLVTAANQEHLHATQPGRYPRLTPEEALVEAAYTFTAHRGQGVMAPAMGQLLDMAREQGARSVITYVAVDNVPSLRGCARIGFRPDHLRINTRRFGQMNTRFVPGIDPRHQALWDAAVPSAAAQAA